MSRGPIGNVLMQMSYEPLWTICVVYLRPIKLCAIFFHIIHLYFSSVQKLTDMNNAIVNFDKLMMHIFAFSLCFVSRLSYCVSINVWGAESHHAVWERVSWCIDMLKIIKLEC